MNYVRDRVGADVHVLVTTQSTGGGGTQYTFKFIGLGRFANVDHSLEYTAPQAATSDERRRGYTAVFKLGLVRYVAETPLASRLTLSFKEPEGQAKAGAVQDPWNFWVFRLGGSGEFDGQESQQDRGASAQCSANRTTNAWKVNINASARYNSEKFKTEEILVRQRELATGYEYELGFGFSYSFGSVFNNIVNPRFRNVGAF